VTLDALLRLRPYTLAGSACAGLAAANIMRPSSGFAFLMASALVGVATALDGAARLAAIALALATAACGWGGARLDALDRSVLVSRVPHVDRTLAEVTGPARYSRFALRLPVRVRSFGALRLSEPALLELPLGRAPPQGAVIATVAAATLPREPQDGFDERGWLRRQGIHVVLRGRSWDQIGQRGGLGAVADGLRRWLARGVAPGLHGERAALLQGIVLGADEGLSEELRNRFRSSGLYHLLAVSGQNVAIIAMGMLLLARLVAVPRWLAELAVLAAIASYVLAVGLQPSVVRAGIAGALASLAWLGSRPRDRWYFLLVGGGALLAWNPYTVLDPGFQLSFVAVASIFVLVPRIDRRLEGYPVPRWLASMLAVSAACGAVTAPILWLDFGRVPVFSILANVFAEPVMAPLLGLGLTSALVYPLVPSLAGVLAWVNGWFAGYLAACARLVGGLPHAQVSSQRAVLLLADLGILAWALTRIRPPRGQRALELGLVGVAAGVAWQAVG